MRLLNYLLCLVSAASYSLHSKKSIMFKPSNKNIQAAFTLPDIPLIPSLLLSTAVVFGIFNIENPVDITDAGKAEARKKRRAERIARGEDVSGKTKGKNLDPYRWRVFEDETDDDNFELINDSKKSGGGCG